MLTDSHHFKKKNLQKMLVQLLNASFNLQNEEAGIN